MSGAILNAPPVLLPLLVPLIVLLPPAVVLAEDVVPPAPVTPEADGMAREVLEPEVLTAPGPLAEADAEAVSVPSTAVSVLSAMPVPAASPAPSALVVARVGSGPSAVESPGAAVTLLTPSVLPSARRFTTRGHHSQALAEDSSGGEHCAEQYGGLDPHLCESESTTR